MELSEPQSDRVVAALLVHLERVLGGDVRTLALELRISEEAARGLLAYKLHTSPALAALAAELLGVTVAALLAGPREEAATVAREAGISEAAIARVLAEPEPLGRRPVLWYVDRMRAVAKLGEGSGEIEAPRSRRAG